MGLGGKIIMIGDAAAPMPRFGQGALSQAGASL
jgi:hypothetical protein